MNRELPTRDLLACLIYLAGAIVALCSFEPFSWKLLLFVFVILVAAYVIAIRKFAMMGGALGAIAVRALFLFFAGKGFGMLFIGLMSATIVYVIFKLDPESSARIE
jgi:hypothetical protein